MNNFAIHHKHPQQHLQLQDLPHNGNSVVDFQSHQPKQCHPHPHCPQNIIANDSPASTEPMKNHRNSSGSSISSISSKGPARKLVQFSQHSEMYTIENGKDVLDNRSQATPRQAKQQLALDARRLGHTLSQASSLDTAVSEDILIECIGIEHLLSIQNVRRAIGHRNAHIQRVLRAQDEVQCGRLTPEELGYVSQCSSRKARVRANTLAVGYWNMSK